MPVKNKYTFSHLFGSFFFSGYFPVASGTFASILAVLLWLPLIPLAVPLKTGIILVTTIVGIISADRCERMLGEKDPGSVVIDEVAGMWLTLSLIPVFSIRGNVLIILVAFAAFRFFDVLKIFPLKQIEKLRGGWGIMFDDLVAGLYAGLVTRLFIWLMR